jgi:hypothetical protein
MFSVFLDHKHNSNTKIMIREELANTIEVVHHLLEEKQVVLSNGDVVPVLPVLTCDLKVSTVLHNA